MPKTLLDFFSRGSKKPQTSNDSTPSVSKTTVVKEKKAASIAQEVEDVSHCGQSSSTSKDDSMKTPEKTKNTPIRPTGKENGVSGSDESPEEKVGSKRKLSEASASVKKKRRRLVVESDSDEEYRPNDSHKSSESEEESEYESEESEEESSEAEESSSASPSPPPKKKPLPSQKSRANQKSMSTTPSTPKNKRTAPNTPSTPSTPSMMAHSVQRRVSDATKSRLSSFAAGDDDGLMGTKEKSVTESDNEWEHLSLTWLKPGNIKDADHRGVDHPDYDPKTLLVPQSYLNKITPGLRQWWTIKSVNYDTVIFFKVGKFYELYHMDAVTAVTELGLIYMKGSFAHSGFPEIAYGRMANRLIEKGYKVARVEQTETAEHLAETAKGRPAKDRVVRREVCEISTPGARSLHARSGDLSTDVGLQKRQFLLALKERGLEGSSGDFTRRFGVAFVDTSEGKIMVGEFDDDRQCSRLRTLFAHYPPAQVLTERHNASTHTQHLLKNCLASSLKEQLVPKKEFWDADRTLLFLGESGHFGEEDFSLPQCLKSMLDDADTLGRSVHPDRQLALSALGGIVFYLKRCFLDQEVLSMKRMEEYKPIDGQSRQAEDGEKGFYERQGHMILDGITLANLDVLVNSGDGSLKGTLIGTLDTCVTPFGKRLLQSWLCSPLSHPKTIRERQVAVGDLMENFHCVESAREKMKKLPDLEKLLTRIHVLGCHGKDASQPDSRAILYEETIYSKWKIKDLLTTLRGFEDMIKAVEELADALEAPLNRALICTDEGKFPNLRPILNHFKNAFDHEKAQKEGKIMPEPGVDDDFDVANQEMKEVQDDLNDYLREWSKNLGCKITYWGSGRNRYQLEIPESHVNRVPRSFNYSGQKKGYKRYKSETTERLMARMIAVEEKKDSALRNVMRNIFAKVDKEFPSWWIAVRCVAEMDALMSLAVFSRGDSGEMCRPEVIESTDPFLDIQDGRHPCLSSTFMGGDYIPNDTQMGVNDQTTCVLVTGPNMGGKSTLMRQTALLVLLGQLGCYVPARKCQFTPIDRIFTRLGASDRMMTGESTFMVELSETAAMLQHATRDSLVLLDELGRGTATYDGTAIASAVVSDLMERIQCRTLFSTHYHALVESFAGRVSLGHMACLVKEDEEKGEDCPEGIIFLYKFIPGACPKSYGFNAARLAHLPEKVVKRGYAKAKELERETLLLKFCREFQRKTFSPDDLNLWRRHFEDMKLIP